MARSSPHSGDQGSRPEKSCNITKYVAPATSRSLGFSSVFLGYTNPISHCDDTACNITTPELNFASHTDNLKM
jgi:hypothetical protein